MQIEETVYIYIWIKNSTYINIYIYIISAQTRSWVVGGATLTNARFTYEG
jgi:hypothetical protein